MYFKGGEGKRIKDKLRREKVTVMKETFSFPSLFFFLPLNSRFRNERSVRRRVALFRPFIDGYQSNWSTAASP